MFQDYDGGGRDRLSPERWETLKQHVSRGARAARAQALREMFAQIPAAARRLSQAGPDLARTLAVRAFAMARRWGAGVARWQERRRAIRELGALDDRALKDFGIHRSEIESVVYGPDSPRVAEGRIAAVLFHMPYDRRSSRSRPPANQLINKTAA